MHYNYKKFMHMVAQLMETLSEEYVAEEAAVSVCTGELHV